MEIKGKVIQILGLQTGQGKSGKEWKKQEFILETPGQYPKKACIAIWGDKIDAINLRIGELIAASIEIESREYNSKWYTEVRAWKVERTDKGAPVENTQQQSSGQHSNSGFANAPAADLSDSELPF